MSSRESAEAESPAHDIALDLRPPGAEGLGHDHMERKPDLLVKLQRFLLGLCGLAVTVLIFLQVFIRYVLQTSVYGIEDLASFIAVWLYFLGGSLGAWERGHISASLVDLVIPSPALRGWIKAGAAALTTVLAGWMTEWAAEYFLFSVKRHQMSLEIGIPMAYVTAAMPICLALMTFYFAVETVDLARAARRRA